MSIISSLMTGNFVSANETEPSKYVREALALRDMEEATKIDQNRIVAGLAKKTADARTLAAMRNARSERVTYDSSGRMTPSAHEMAVSLVRDDAAAAEAEAAAKSGKFATGAAGPLDSSV